MAVRLNTNEAPEPPPAGFRDALGDAAGRASTGTATPTGGPPSCGPSWPPTTASTRRWSSSPTAPTRCCRPLCLAYGGAGRTVAVFEPTYALHSHIARITGTEVAVGERRADFTDRPRRGAAGHRRAAAGHHLPVLAQQPHRHHRPARGARRRAGPRPRARRGRRGLRPVRPALGGRRRRRPTVRSSWCARSRRRGRWRRPASATAWPRRRWSRRSTRWCCRTTSTRPSRSPASSPSTSRPRCTHGSPRWSRSGAAWWPRSPTSPVDVFPSGANFVLFRPRGARRQGGVAGPARPVGAGARLLVVAPPRGLPARHDRHPRRGRRLPRRPHRRCSWQ